MPEKSVPETFHCNLPKASWQDSKNLLNTGFWRVQRRSRAMKIMRMLPKSGRSAWNGRPKCVYPWRRQLMLSWWIRIRYCIGWEVKVRRPLAMMPRWGVFRPLSEYAGNNAKKMVGSFLCLLCIIRWYKHWSHRDICVPLYCNALKLVTTVNILHKHFVGWWCPINFWPVSLNKICNGFDNWLYTLKPKFFPHNKIWNWFDNGLCTFKNLIMSS